MGKLSPVFVLVVFVVLEGVVYAGKHKKEPAHNDCEESFLHHLEHKLFKHCISRGNEKTL